MFTLHNIKSNKNLILNISATLRDVFQLINENKSGCVILIDNKKAQGIITESDLINAIQEKYTLSTLAIDIANTNIIYTEENRPIDFAFDILHRHNIKRLILQDQNGLYQGVVLQEDLIQHIESDVYKVDLKLKSLIDPSFSIYSVDENTSLEDTLNLMHTQKIGSVLITQNDTYIGIVTEKDIIEAIYSDVDILSAISLYMTSPIIAISQNSAVEDTIELMHAKKIRRVMVKDDHDQIVSILSNRDILQYVKGNYTTILQNKIKQAQDIMNLFPEPIIEVYYTKEKSIISWINTIGKKSFGEKLIDQEINNLIDETSWNNILNSIDTNHKISNIILPIETQTYEVSGTVLDNITSKYIKLIFKDVTSYETKNKKLQNVIDKEIDKRLESEYLLMQQAKLATMGEMIGHIAHQWRQPLAKLGGIFMNLESSYTFGELTKEYLQEKLHAGNKLIKYMSNTIDDFRNFFEPASNKEIFNINDQIQNALNLLNASLLYRHISIDFQNTKEYFALGYPSEFSQVILNIVANAEDVLVARNIENGIISIKLLQDDTKTIIRIQDNAGGIEKKNLSKIFDSYFTTKHRKEGSGLGLYMSKLIIETKLDGKIMAQNDKQGAVFSILLDKI